LKFSKLDWFSLTEKVLSLNNWFCTYDCTNEEKLATTVAVLPVAVITLSHTKPILFSLHRMELASSKSSTSQASSSPMQDASILEIIFSYVSPGHWLFLGTLSKSCKQSCLNVEQREISFWDEDRYHDVTVQCKAQLTLSSAAFSSLACFQLAIEHGMPLPSSNSRRQQRIAGQHASIETLQVAHELGLEFTDALVRGAAEADSLAKLKWLHTEHGCQFNRETVVSAAKTGQLHVCKFLVSSHGCALLMRACLMAISRGDVELLSWLRANGCTWDQRYYCTYAAAHGSVQMMAYLLAIESSPGLLTAALNSAGACDLLAAAQWLRQRGAEWPAVLLINRGYDVWSGESLAWARAEGCTSEVPEVLLNGYISPEELDGDAPYAPPYEDLEYGELNAAVNL
jgi:hypothetical protein